MITTKEQERAALDLFLAVADAIRDLSAISPLKGVPSGELYTRLSGTLSIGTYEALIASLVRAKVVKNVGHLLMWVGPPAPINQLTRSES